MTLVTTFPRVPRTVKGYDVDEVDDFFYEARKAYEHGGPGPSGRRLSAAEVRRVAFALKRGGYDVHEVDAALDRLEDAVAAREREQLIADGGDEALIGELTKRAATLQGRLDRPAGQRFSRGKKRLEMTYDVEDVDNLCEKLAHYFSDGQEMSADEVRRAVFRTRWGPSGYREPEVDAFLDRAVEVMVAVD